MRRTELGTQEPPKARLAGIVARALGVGRESVRALARNADLTSVPTATDAELAACAADLAAARAAAERAERCEAGLLAFLDREVRAPMQGLVGLAERLSTAAAPRERRLAEVISRSAAGLLTNLADALGRAEDQVGAIEPAAQPLDIVEVAEDVCALYWDQATAKGLDLAVYVDPDTPHRIRGDAARLRKVLGVLIRNAVAVAEQGGVMVEVEPLDAGSLCVSVRDTGPALPKDAVARLFGAPSAGDPREPRPSDGLGYGLADCKRVVEAMGGRLSASSEVGRGSTFAFRLPAEAIKPAPGWPAMAEPGRVAYLAVQGLASRRALCRYLTRSGLSLGALDDPALALCVVDSASDRRVGDAAPTVRLTERDEVASDTPQHGREAVAALLQPFRRQDLEALLRQLCVGRPLCERPVCRSVVPPPAAPPISSADAKLLHDLERALDAEHLTLAYQPQVDRDGEKIIGVEALLRWTHPDHGPVSPAAFIPLAERQGMIARITTWVVDRMLAETRYLKGLQVAFNASALEFAEGGFVERLTGLIDSHGYDPRRLEVEITETAILQNEGAVRETIDRLRALGMKVALDDFGAGYSSISHLRRYPFDKLKIDREFITDCSRDMQAATVVHAVVSIGRALGMKVIAEGVETETQRRFLRVAGVHAMQGYLFGRPVSVDELTRMLAAPVQRARA